MRRTLVVLAVLLPGCGPSLECADWQTREGTRWIGRVPVHGAHMHCAQWRTKP